MSGKRVTERGHHGHGTVGVSGSPGGDNSVLLLLGRVDVGEDEVHSSRGEEGDKLGDEREKDYGMSLGKQDVAHKRRREWKENTIAKFSARLE